MISRYVLAKWVQTPDGWRPALPEGAGFKYLGEAGRKPTFALFSIREEVEPSSLVSEVPESLVTLLDSAHSYPPALALAINHMMRHESMSVHEFAVKMERVVREQLLRQRDHPCCLIASLIEEIGYRSIGEFVWIVGYDAQRVAAEVHWVASDFQSYHDDVQTFDVEPSWLVDRFD